MVEPFLNMDDFFNTTHSLHRDLFSRNIFDHLGKNLHTWICQLLIRLECHEQPVMRDKVQNKISPLAHIEGQVFIDSGAIIEPFAYICGPTYIGPRAEVRQGAYIRGNAYIGAEAVVGHTTEVKSSIFLDGAKAGHFAYVGDSILGLEVNLGAGTKLANFKFRGDNVFFNDPDTGERINSGLRKFGSILGDRVNTGCNSVLDPGSLLFPDTAVYPCRYFKGNLLQGVFK